MTHYRLYFIDEHGHIAQFEEFEAGSDEQALVDAERKADGRRAELWRGAEKVRRFEAI